MQIHLQAPRVKERNLCFQLYSVTKHYPDLKDKNPRLSIKISTDNVTVYAFVGVFCNGKHHVLIVNANPLVKCTLTLAPLETLKSPKIGQLALLLKNFKL